MILKILLIFLEIVEILSEVTWKLPESVIPQHQKVKLLVDLENQTFSGVTQILVNCVEDTHNVTLHSRWLDIHQNSVTVERNGTVNAYLEIAGISFQEQQEFLTISLKEFLEEDNVYRLCITYEGRISEDAWGFFNGRFNDLKNKSHVFAATHFEPTYARQAFPCFDEPALKVSFEITIGRQGKFTTLSNMPLLKSESIENMDGWFWDHFDKTPNMSSYLVAFAIFDGYDKVTYGSLSIWSTKDTVHLLDLALKYTPMYIGYFGKYFRWEYNVPKIDLIALPRYPSWAGAMENWGLNTYTEDILLHCGSDDDIFTALKKTVIAHELAHQWFGNLVTMKCWGQLWLKESFATYFSLIAVDAVIREGHFEIEFTKNHMSIISYDGNRTLNSECVWDHAKAKSLLDSTTYLRGGPILRMTQYMFGLDDLRTTAKIMFQLNSYSNYDSDDLIYFFQRTIELPISLRDIPIKDVMRSWLDEPRFPLVQVNRSSRNGTVIFKQEPFHNISGGEDQCWWIPITYTSFNNLYHVDFRTKIWMRCPREQVEIKDTFSTTWLLVNVQMSGLYVVEYDEANWSMLSKTLMHWKQLEYITPIDRFQLVFDRLILAFYGRVSYESLLETLLYLKHETQYTPWKPAVDFFKKLKYWLDDEPELVGMFVRNLTQPLYSVNVTNYKISTTIETDFRQLIAKTACDFNLTECLSDMFAFYKLYKKATLKENPIPKEFRSLVYCLVLNEGKERDVEVFLKKFKEIQFQKIFDPDELRTMENSMKCMKKKTATPRSFFSSARSFELLADQLSTYNDDIEFLLKDLENEDPHLIARWLPEIADQVYYAEDLKLLEEFSNKNGKNLSIYQDAVDVSIRKAKRNIKWKVQYGDVVKRTLRRILNITEVTTPQNTKPENSTSGPIIQPPVLSMPKKVSTGSWANNDSNCFCFFLVVLCYILKLTLFSS